MDTQPIKLTAAEAGSENLEPDAQETDGRVDTPNASLSFSPTIPVFICT